MDSSKIKEYLQLCKSAYADTKHSVGYHTCVDLINESGKAIDVQAKIFVNNDTKELVIAVRGTENITDAVTDINCQKVEFDYFGPRHDNCKVHKGFYVSAKVISNIVNEYITELEPKKITCTGHSLGGAVATLLPTMMTTGIKPDVITFGSPRVGNSAFVTHFHAVTDESVRVVNGVDPVTKLPLLLMGFRHVGGMLHIGDNITTAAFKTYGNKTKILAYHFLDNYDNNLF